MSTVTPSRPVAGNALTMPDLGRRYLAPRQRTSRSLACVFVVVRRSGWDHPTRA